MEANHMNGRVSPPSSSADGGTTAGSCSSLLQPNYSSRAVQEALEHLASVDLIELCSEAKVERCRATRDLRSCGRYVHYALNTCGHASLCSECSQRSDICPICRIPIPKNGNKLRLRLYYECIEAGLISKRCDERFQEKEDWENQLNADVERLYSLFDVAMENNLVSLICHYVTDVCMDETAVSSDPVIAFLLDEVVVKDWCKRTFRNIMLELQRIYNLEVKEMKNRWRFLPKLSRHLTAVLNVLEVLASSFRDSLSAKLHDLQLLEEHILKTKQHLDIMAWCIRHEFLEDVTARYPDFLSWNSVLRERKSAAIRRSWPGVVNQSSEPSMEAGSLFIEDALANLEGGHEDLREMGDETELASLMKDETLHFRSKIEGIAGCYPFKSLQAAVDLLFLRGSSDLVVAKQAIFLYYLFDRHWKMRDETWRHIVDDFAASFGLTRHSLLESLVFYLLDDHTDEALQEACDLLPEISGPSTHPKITQVLLERGVPETALMVLRWCGRDGSQLVSLNEAVTAVRVRVECGLLTEAFMHQRMVCTKVKEKKSKGGPLGDASDILKGECRTWEEWVEILVTEICCLCIKSTLADRMIDLPWNLDEEKFVHKCLLDYATHDPSASTGSLLVVYYLQRYRYAEAYHVDITLQSLEQNFIAANSISEEVLSKIRSASHWRGRLVSQSIELLPKDQQRELQAGKLSLQLYKTSNEEVEKPVTSVLPGAQEPMLGNIVVLPSGDTNANQMTPFKASVLQTPKFGESHFAHKTYSSQSVLQERLFTNAEVGLNPQMKISRNARFDSISTPQIHRINSTNAMPSKDVGRTSSNILPGVLLHPNQFYPISTDMEENGFTRQYQSNTPTHYHKVTTNVIDGSKPSFPNGSAHVPRSNMWIKRVHSRTDDRSFNVNFGDDMMGSAWR
uniref:ELYS-like domain-containing protein n=1 Tax=Rhizophora mucronata TaxID=61149 RepID=A0A2P2KTH0_RHIMU